jgi:hypothetical protein
MFRPHHRAIQSWSRKSNRRFRPYVGYPEAARGISEVILSTARKAYKRMGNDPLFDLRSELYRIAGVDFTDIPGVRAVAAQVGLTEVEPDLSRYGNASAIVSRLGLCPDQRISGGKVLSTKTRKGKNRVAIVLRRGAKSLFRVKDHFLRFSAECEPGSSLLRLSPQPCTRSHASSTTSYTPKKLTQRQSSTAAMKKNSNEPKCAFANKPHNSA